MSQATFFWEKPSTLKQRRAKQARLQFSNTVLRRNLIWFINLRWLVIAILTGGQLLLSLFDTFIKKLNITVSGYWPVGIAILLLIENLGVIELNKRFSNRAWMPRANIWIQMSLDLIALIFVIHFIGSITTPAPFIFLFHITLACIFFNKPTSFGVTLFSILLVDSLILIEYTGHIQPVCIFFSIFQYLALQNRMDVIQLGLFINAIFLTIWYLVSTVSYTLRENESKLLEAEESTRLAHKDKEKYLMTLTHQLKSPLDAIRSHIAQARDHSMLTSTHIHELIHDIEHRAECLGATILDALKLQRLKTHTAEDRRENVDVRQILTTCIQELTPAIQAKKITLLTDIQPFNYLGIPSQIEKLIHNLLSNALNYSRPEGEISIRTTSDDLSGSTVLTVTDTGIGIDPEKLPNIFNEFYRTQEALTHNRNSTGMGLAIVKQVAQNHGLKIQIASQLGQGTSFSVYFPLNIKDSSWR